MTSHLLFSNHVTMVANFEKFLISASFILNVRKSNKISELAQKLRIGLRVGKEPGPNRVNVKMRRFIVVDTCSFGANLSLTSIIICFIFITNVIIYGTLYAEQTYLKSKHVYKPSCLLTTVRISCLTLQKQ